MTTKLSQILAIEKSIKTSHHQAMTEAYKLIQKPTLFQGIRQTYTPRDPNDLDLVPDKEQAIQYTTKQMLDQAKQSLERILEVTASRDYTNTVAKADVIVDGTTLIKDAPVPFLLFLEKQLSDIRAFVSALPTLDPAQVWEFDENSGQFKTKELKQYRNKKVPRNHVQAPATDKHPAQVQVYHEDVVVGDYVTIKFSGEMKQADVQKLLAKVNKLQEAVKFAREQANTYEVNDQRGKMSPVVSFLFG